ncbi:MAG: glutathione binding-like protein [Gammaproteobacteria bacterium]
MIDYYFWTTPNGYKALLFLKETALDHRIQPINISRGEQFDPEFLRVSPNNKIPAIVDHNPVDEFGPITLFESGAILTYLADKTRQYLPRDARGRAKVLQWLNWQMAGIGPIFGQNLHFSAYASEQLPYAIDRFKNETSRLLMVLDKQLDTREYIAGDYSIADMAIYPWIFKYPQLDLDLSEYLNVSRWFQQIAERPATVAAYETGALINTQPTFSEASRDILLGQSAETLAHT